MTGMIPTQVLTVVRAVRAGAATNRPRWSERCCGWMLPWVGNPDPRRSLCSVGNR